MAIADIDHAASRAKRSRKLKTLARFGYAARGVVYAVVGGLAVLAAFGEGGQVTGSRGALAQLMRQPGSDVILILIGIGLIGFAIWRFLQGFADADERGDDKKAMTRRSAWVISGVIYLSLAAYAVYLVWGISGGGAGGGGGEETRTASMTARLMQQPFGQWLVGLVGAAIVAGGVAQFVTAVRARFQRSLKADPSKMKWIVPLGRAGYAARGVVFLIMGGFLIVAAYQAQPGQARGLGGALRTLQEQPYGPWLLALVALGLLAFGAYGVVQAMYRRIPAGT